VHLSGGEPLLRDDFGAIVRCAKDLGLFVSLTTSGFRVEEQIEALRCADQVQISFDGPEAVRIALCGEECARVAARAVDVLERHGVPFWTVTVLTKLNLAHIDWVVDHARQHGILANFVAMDRQAETWNEANPMPPAARELLPAGDELRAAFRRLIALKQAGAPIGSSMPYLREVLDWEDYGETLSPRRSRRYRCVAWQSQCELLANGELHVCDWTRRRGMGVSVRAYGFKGAWERLPRPADCRSCLTSCALEPNLILSLNPGAVLNWGRRLIRFPVAGGSPP
jgi:MoaA/NifB/PqqE/SkfB family radical SAM enzyme